MMGALYLSAWYNCACATRPRLGMISKIHMLSRDFYKKLTFDWWGQGAVPSWTNCLGSSVSKVYFPTKVSARAGTFQETLPAPARSRILFLSVWRQDWKRSREPWGIARLGSRNPKRDNLFHFPCLGNNATPRPLQAPAAAGGQMCMVLWSCFWSWCVVFLWLYIFVSVWTFFCWRRPKFQSSDGKHARHVCTRMYHNI